MRSEAKSAESHGATEPSPKGGGMRVGGRGGRTLTIKTFTLVSALSLSACGGGGETPYGGRKGENEGEEGEAEGEEPGGGSVCGNGECDLGEAVDACPEDCGEGQACGNGFCDASEDGTSCSLDCGSTGVAPCHVQRTGSQKVGAALPLGVHCGSVHFASCSCTECEAVWETAGNVANWAKECGSLGGGAYFPNGCDDPNCSFTGTLCTNVATPLSCDFEPCCALDSLCGDGECVSGIVPDGGEDCTMTENRGECCCPVDTIPTKWGGGSCGGKGSLFATFPTCNVDDPSEQWFLCCRYK